MDEVKPASVSQPVLSTRKRCISGTVEIAPPMDSSDSVRKCRNRLKRSAGAIT
jgi:hypothetical protein